MMPMTSATTLPCLRLGLAAAAMPNCAPPNSARSTSSNEYAPCEKTVSSASTDVESITCVASTSGAGD